MMPITRSNEHVYYPGLDALRGMAIVMVLLYHYFHFFRIGWMGVDLFFVLSGFLITSILLKSREHGHYFGYFFIRRMLRIFPLYFATLLVFFISLPYVFSVTSPGSVYHYYNTHQIWFWTFLENWLFIKKGPPPEPYLVHFWSLAVEEQFYLAWPFLVFFVKDLVKLKYFIAAVFFLASLLRIYFWNNAAGHEVNYYHSLTRADSLAAGAFLAVCSIQGKQLPRYSLLVTTMLFLALLGGSWWIEGNFYHYNAVFATIGYSVTALFFMALCDKALDESKWRLNTEFLKFTGRISYGLYVFHLPVLLIFSTVVNRFFSLKNPDKSLSSILVSLVSLAITFVLSFISYRFFELPLLRLRNKFRQHTK